MAAVPATDSSLISYGRERDDAARRARDSARQHALAAALAQVEARIVELDDAATRPYTPTVISSAMPTSTATRTPNAAVPTVPSVITMISADRMKSVRMAPLILSRSTARGSTVGIDQDGAQFLAVRVVLRAVHERVRDLLEALVAEEQAAGHQQRRDRPGRDRADRERRRHQDRLVDQRTLCHRPHHRQLAVRLDAGDLLRVQRQVVAQHAGRLLRCGLGQDGDVVQHAGDVVEQGKEAGAGHAVTRPLLQPEPPLEIVDVRAARAERRVLEDLLVQRRCWS